MICAAEDVGNADPMALVVAVSAAQAVEDRDAGIPDHLVPGSALCCGSAEE